MMNTFFATYKQLENMLGHVKFAVTIILIFTAYLIYGTFMESYHGTDYANRLVYKSLPFMAVQLLMFLSILVATLQRLPMKRHLYGFYVLHLGLLILFLGSFVTYQAGVDGNMTLAPNTPTRQVQLNTDQISFELPDQQKVLTLELPYVSSEKVINFKWEDITILRFLPFAEEVTAWKEDKLADTTRLHSGEYKLNNDNFTEQLTLSLHPKADFESTTQLGPLNVHYMPELLAQCFNLDSHDGLLVWDARQGRCFAPNASNLRLQKGLAGKTLLVLQQDGEELRFLPDLSPLPVDKDLKLIEDSTYRIFSRKLFQDKPHLFLFGRFVSYFERETSKWVVHPLAKDPVPLPWMGFQITLLNHQGSQYPVREPTSVTPIQDNGQLIKGNLKAIEVDVAGTRFWVTSERAMSMERAGGPAVFQLARKSLTLPFEVTLDQFKMDTDPGTTNPASYESFVSLFKGNAGTSKHHVFMNNPMKHDAFTFYQASYFQTQQGPYGSVFSVNYDPGRFWKYLGSLLLVLGSLWHFVFRSKPKSSAEVVHA